MTGSDTLACALGLVGFVALSFECGMLVWWHQYSVKPTAPAFVRSKACDPGEQDGTNHFSEPFERDL